MKERRLPCSSCSLLPRLELLQGHGQTCCVAAMKERRLPCSSYSLLLDSNYYKDMDKHAAAVAATMERRLPCSSCSLLLDSNYYKDMDKHAVATMERRLPCSSCSLLLDSNDYMDMDKHAAAVATEGEETAMFIVFSTTRDSNDNMLLLQRRRGDCHVHRVLYYLDSNNYKDMDKHAAAVASSKERRLPCSSCSLLLDSNYYMDMDKHAVAAATMERRLPCSSCSLLPRLLQLQGHGQTCCCCCFYEGEETAMYWRCKGRIPDWWNGISDYFD